MEQMPSIETQRLLLRPLTHGDFDRIAPMLRNPKVMYAWEHTFTDGEITDWIERNLARYREKGYGYYAAIEKATGRLAGQIGLLPEMVDEEERLGIGYLLDEPYQGRGYATEGAAACARYAFEEMGAAEVLCEIRPENTGSVAVACRLGMERTGSFVKHHNGVDMVHDLYVLTKEGWQRHRSKGVK